MYLRKILNENKIFFFRYNFEKKKTFFFLKGSVNKLLLSIENENEGEQCFVTELI